MAMKDNSQQSKPIPPYLPYRTFETFLQSLKVVGLPQRIDRSLMKSMSGGLQSQLMAALEFLNLIAPGSGIPTERLTRLVTADGPKRQDVLKETLMGSYSFLSDGTCDLERATASQVRECFGQGGASGDTLRKCVAFFLKAAKDAGLELSPHVKSMTRGRQAPVRRKQRQAPLAVESENNSAVSSEATAAMPEDIAWNKALLDKYPQFDPAWPDDVKKSWFDGFKELLALKKGPQNA